jgi:hypothetical protein
MISSTSLEIAAMKVQAVFNFLGVLVLLAVGFV